MFPKLFDVLRGVGALVGAVVMFLSTILIIPLVALLLSKPACSQGACVTNTYFVDGKMVVCQTCCNGNTCNTACF